MSSNVRVMVQVRGAASFATTSFSPFAAAPSFKGMAVETDAVEFDSSYSPVPLPGSVEDIGRSRFGFMSFNERAPEQTYIVRARLPTEKLEDFVMHSRENPNIVGVFADPAIQPIHVCPNAPIGSDRDVESALMIQELRSRGLDGAGVKVVVVDSGINMNYLNARGKSPGFDRSLSWGPKTNQPLGNMPVGHGTMCAFDICIAAPSCMLIDHALLTSTATGGSGMDGLLSDAVASYATLLSYMMRAQEPLQAMRCHEPLSLTTAGGCFILPGIFQ